MANTFYLYVSQIYKFSATLVLKLSSYYNEDLFLTKISTSLTRMTFHLKDSFNVPINISCQLFQNDYSFCIIWCELLIKKRTIKQNETNYFRSWFSWESSAHNFMKDKQYKVFIANNCINTFMVLVWHIVMKLFEQEIVKKFIDDKCLGRCVNDALVS